MQLTVIKDAQHDEPGVACVEHAIPGVGELTIRRASHVEPDERGRWLADLTPVGGPVLGPFDRRGAALAAEQQWLNSHWLT